MRVGLAKVFVAGIIFVIILKTNLLCYFHTIIPTVLDSGGNGPSDGYCNSSC